MGKDVKNFKVGDIVAHGPFRDSCAKCRFCLKGQTNACIGMEVDERCNYGKYFGGFSTHYQHPQSHFFKLPSNLDYKKIAPIMCAGITTFTPMFGNVQKGDKVAILGCGGLGHFALQWAVKMGAEVDVFSSSHKKDDLIKKLGGKNVVIWTEGEHKKLLNHYDVIVNTLPVNEDQETLTSLMNCLTSYGKWIQVGFPEIDGGNIVVNIMTMLFTNRTYIGSLVGGLYHYQKMFEFVEKHGVECICEHYDFEDFDKALDKLENGRPFFRCVVDTEKYTKFQ